jgi:hypothetical protein
MNKPASGETPQNPDNLGNKPHQSYFFGPWRFDVDQALAIIADNPRPTRQLPVYDWANAFGIGELRRPNTIPLLGIGPDFDADYALTSDLADPLLIATLVDKEGVASPLFIDGMHRLYRAYLEDIAELPAYVLTPEESLAIRKDRYLG